MKKNWTIIVFLLTFFLSALFSALSVFIEKYNNYFLVSLTFFIILLGIIFDVIGTASLSSNVKVFHSKASQKIKGSKEAVFLSNNSDKVASVCNDVIGDICGIISGGLSAILIIKCFNGSSVFNILITALISSLTVGGKALGKSYAVKKSDDIIFRVGKILSIFTKK